MFEFNYWKNTSYSVYNYSFFWGKLDLEFEIKSDRSFDPCILTQWGGDHVYCKHYSIFGGSATLNIWPLH